MPDRLLSRVNVVAEWLYLPNTESIPTILSVSFQSIRSPPPLSFPPGQS